MGIGVSYSGANGATKSFTATSAEELLNELQAQSGGAIDNSLYHRLKEARRQARHEKLIKHGLNNNVPNGPEKRDKVDAKSLVDGESSIEESQGKLRLVGDSRTLTTGEIYGVGPNGKRGYCSLLELLEFIDKREDGEVVGVNVNEDLDENGASRDANSKRAFSICVSTRVFSETRLPKENTDPWYGLAVRNTFVASRIVSFTGGGRAFKVSEETVDQVSAEPIGVAIKGTDDEHYVGFQKIAFVKDDNGNGADVRIKSSGGGNNPDVVEVFISGGDIEVTGTDGVTVKGKALRFASESDSNVTVKATVDGSGLITTKIGVYWWRG